MPDPVPDREPLDERTVDPDPITQVRRWYAEAEATAGRDDQDPAAMALATATTDGRPSARFVLLRGLDDRGFVFFTNYDSRKGRELGANPRGALVLHWPWLRRQVRVEGAVERLTPVESESYFVQRPRGHRLAAWASRQSEPIASRTQLEGRLADFTERFAPLGDDLPCPPFWGGFRVMPDEIELWESRADRLHDRVRYRRAAGAPGWLVARLSP